MYVETIDVVVSAIGDVDRPPHCHVIVWMLVGLQEIVRLMVPGDQLIPRITTVVVVEGNSSTTLQGSSVLSTNVSNIMTRDIRKVDIILRAHPVLGMGNNTMMTDGPQPTMPIVGLRLATINLHHQVATITMETDIPSLRSNVPIHQEVMPANMKLIEDVALNGKRSLQSHGRKNGSGGKQ